jgi:hypothetical protein
MCQSAQHRDLVEWQPMQPGYDGKPIGTAGTMSIELVMLPELQQQLLAGNR